MNRTGTSKAMVEVRNEKISMLDEFEISWQ